jgi:hypothetical protein
MDRDRTLELAIEALQLRKAQIDAEIEMIRSELSGSETAIAAQSVVTAGRSGRSRTLAQRKAQSQKMKARWAARKAKAVKAGEPAPLSAKSPKSAGSSINNAIQAFLAKRKAEVAGNNATAKPTGNKSPKKPSGV